ncbi:MAG: dihydrofolate reductase, partial [Janthinobacterium lividum]
ATWESLPPRFRPLPGRRNLVLSRDPGYVAEGAEVVHDLASALASAADGGVIGGHEVYRGALGHADRLVVTEVDLEVAGDVRAPEVGAGWRCTHVEPPRGWATSQQGPRYRIGTWERTGSDKTR